MILRTVTTGGHMSVKDLSEHFDGADGANLVQDLGRRQSSKKEIASRIRTWLSYWLCKRMTMSWQQCFLYCDMKKGRNSYLPLKIAIIPARYLKSNRCDLLSVIVNAVTKMIESLEEKGRVNLIVSLGYYRSPTEVDKDPDCFDLELTFNPSCKDADWAVMGGAKFVPTWELATGSQVMKVGSRIVPNYKFARFK